MTRQRITGVVVNYRTPELTMRATDSLLADGVDEVVIIENGSADGSAATLEAFVAGRPRTTLIVSNENVGFGRGANLGAASASGDYLFLLNSDAVVEPGCTASLRDAFLSDDTLAIAAPLVLDAAGSRQIDAYGEFPGWSTVLRRSNRRPPDVDEPDWVSGVAILIAKTYFERAGGFDARFFMYFEDVDLCRRLRASGGRIRRVRSAVVRHHHQASRRSVGSFLSQYYEAQDQYLDAAGWKFGTRLMFRMARLPIRMWRSLARPRVRPS